MALSELRLVPRAAWWIAASSVIMVTSGWTVGGLFLRETRETVVQSQAASQMALARLLDEHLARVFSATDAALLSVKESLEASPQPPLSAASLGRAHRMAKLPDALLDKLLVVDAAGTLRAVSRDTLAHHVGQARIAENHGLSELREQSRQHVSFSPPSRGDIDRGHAFIRMGRAIEGPDGALRGAVFASLSPSHFSDLFRDLELADDSELTLRGPDGTVLARVRDDGLVDDHGLETVPTVRRLLLHADQGTDIVPATGNNPARLVTVHRVSGYPLVIETSASVDRILSGHDRLAAVMLAMGVAVTLLSAVATVLAIRSVLRMRASEQAARRTDEAKSQFLSSMSHELRTPLTGILGFAALLEQRLPEQRLREPARLIRTSAERLRRLLDEILDLSRVEAGEMPVCIAPADVGAIVEETCQLFEVAAQQKGLALRRAVEADVPPAVACDELRLRQILSNLLSNAIKFTTSGHVDVAVRRVGSTRLEIRVRDTGPGVPEELRETVFERFRQADADVARQHGGTGLGLALSRGFARMMGGSLRLAPDGTTPGATFVLELPLSDVPTEDARPAVAVAA